MDDLSLSAAAEAIRTGGVVAYPTEAVYGLGCDPTAERAVAKILEMKSRSVDQGLLLIAASVDQLRPFIGPLSDEATARVLATWPGPTTWVVPASDATPAWITGAHAGVAVRVTAHPVAAALCEAAGTAIVSTSANLHGCAPAKTAEGTVAVFGESLDAVVLGECGGLVRPTEIRDAVTGNIVRPG